MKKVLAVTFLALALSLTACGGSSSSEAKTCAAREGQVLTEQQWDQACTVDGAISVTMAYDCKDGTKMHWDKFGYGSTTTPYTKYTGSQPDAAIAECLNR